MRRHGVDVGGDDVGLDPVGGDGFGGRAVADRVDQREQFPGAAMVAELGEGHDRPDRGVGVLAAVFAHAGDVALDVAGIECGLVERRIEELDQAVDRGGPAGGRLRPSPCAIDFRVARAGEDRPALGDRVDLAFGVGRRAERLPSSK